MKDEIQVLKKIRHQIAHCMAFYGDQPDELMYKLECVVLEWFEKGINSHSPKRLGCPNCCFQWKPGHMDWEAFKCEECKMMVNKEQWIDIKL